MAFYRGERRWVILSRGVLAFCAMICLIIYGAFQLVLYPITETGLTPSKVYQSHLMGYTFESSEPVVYTVLVVCDVLLTSRSRRVLIRWPS